MRDLKQIGTERETFSCFLYRPLREELSLWGKGVIAIALLVFAFGIL